MAEKSAVVRPSEVTEFLVVSIPDPAAPGASLRLLRVVNTREQAEVAVSDLDSSTLGRVAILQRIALYTRRPTVESLPTNESLTTT